MAFSFARVEGKNCERQKVEAQRGRYGSRITMSPVCMGSTTK